MLIILVLLSRTEAVSKESTMRASTFLNWIGKSVALIVLQWQIARERSALARLTDEELRDIGVSREDALRESQRSACEIPANRLKRKTAHRRNSANVGSLRLRDFD
jgi:uncharacterized protein YjiS (DUF1127 family)